MSTIPDSFRTPLDWISDAPTRDDVAQRAFSATFFLTGWREDTLPLLEVIHARARAREAELRDVLTARIELLDERLAGVR